MAKYFIAFIALALVALENNSIYKRLHVDSHPSIELNSNEGSFYHKHKHLQQAHQRYPHNHHQHNHNHHHRNDNNQQQQQQEEAVEDSSNLLLDRQRQRQHQHRHHTKHHQTNENVISNQDTPNFEMLSSVEEDLKRIRQHYAQKQHHYDNIKQQQVVEKQKHFTDSSEDYVDPEDDTSVEEDSQRIRQHYIRQQRHLQQHSVINTENEDQPQEHNLSIADEIPPFITQNLVEDSIEENSNTANADQAKAAAEATVTVPMGCPKCQSERAVERISEEELTRLRIEFVKQQILEKLRLKERPNVSAIALPKPISEGTTIQHEDESIKNKELDDHYARTSKKFILLQRENYECQNISMQPSMCFSFKIDDAYADGIDVSTAVLWIYKNKTKTEKPQSQNSNTTLYKQQTIVVSEVTQKLESEYLPILKPIAIQSIDVQDDWMKIDIEWPIKRWFGNHELSHLIHISCQSCEINSMEEIIPLDSRFQPFIIIDAQQATRKVSRHKRDINCANGVKECCREKLYISFDEIGWGDWIVQPRGYDAYFCRGSCSSVASVAQFSSQHSVLMKKAMSSQLSSLQKSLELIPCCTAKQYSSLQIVFMDSNNTATQKTFPNMVVESCGCQ